MHAFIHVTSAFSPRPPPRPTQQQTPRPRRPPRSPPPGSPRRAPGRDAVDSSGGMPSLSPSSSLLQLRLPRDDTASCSAKRDSYSADSMRCTSPSSDRLLVTERRPSRELPAPGTPEPSELLPRAAGCCVASCCPLAAALFGPRAFRVSVDIRAGGG